MPRALKPLVSLGMLLALGYVIATREGLGDALASLRDVRLEWVTVAVAVQLVAVVCGVVRWRALLGSQGVRLSRMTTARHFLVGRFVGVFTPSTVGLDGYRVVAAARETGRKAGAARALIIEKALSFVALAATSFALLPLGAGRFFGRAGVAASAALGLGAMLGLTLLLRPAWLHAVVARLPGPLGRPGGKLDGLVTALAADPIPGRTLTLAFLAGAMSLLMGAATVVGTGMALGVGATPLELLAIGHAIVLAMLVPVSVAGLGVREGTAALLLGMVGVPAADAALVGLLAFLVTQPAALLGGLVHLRSSAPKSPVHSPTDCLPAPAAS